MRSFIITTVLFLLAALTGCAADKNSCAETDDCTPTPDSCGDSACRASDGETAQNCPEDCVPASCGDGTCSAASHETAENCADDCSVSCVADPEKPVYCGDTMTCWAAGTDCLMPTYMCAGQMQRCGYDQEGDNQANCCNDRMDTCPSDRPYFCPEQNLCVATKAECPSAAAVCTTWGLNCTH